MDPVTNKDFELGEEVVYQGVPCRVISISRPDGKIHLSGIGPAILPTEIELVKEKEELHLQ